MNNIEKVYGFIFLVLTFLFGAGGVYILYKAGRIDVTTPKFSDINPQETGESQIEKKDKMVKEWNETNQHRDKLKVLQAATEAELDN